MQKQPGVLPKGQAKLRQLLGSARQPIGGRNLKNTKNPANYIKFNDAKYGKDNFKITNRYPYRQGHQNDKLSYYAGNAWGANTDARLPMTSSEYYPKQAEVLEEFVEGDDPAEKAEYEQISSDKYNNDDGYGAKDGFTQNLIPIMNSEDAVIDDDSSEDELATKNHVPKHSN